MRSDINWSNYIAGTFLGELLVACTVFVQDERHHCTKLLSSRRVPRLKQSDQRMRQVGQRIRVLLSERGLTQERLAFENEVPKSTISHIMSGAVRPSLVTLEKIAAGLGVELFELFIDPSESERHQLIEASATASHTALKQAIAVLKHRPRSR